MINKLRGCFGKGFMVNFNFEYTMLNVAGLVLASVVDKEAVMAIVGLCSLLYFFKFCGDNEYTFTSSVFRFIGFKICDAFISTLSKALLLPIMANESVGLLAIATLIIFATYIFNFTYWSQSYNK